MSFLETLSNKVSSAFGGGQNNQQQQDPTQKSQQDLSRQKPDPQNPDPNAKNPLEKVDPLAQFKMFDTIKDDPSDVAPVFAIPKEALSAASAAIDFTAGIDPVILEAADNGDGKAIRKVQQLMAQAAYSHALEHSAALTNKFTDAREGYNGKKLGSRVRGELTASAMADIPGYSNPTVKKQLGIWAEELQKQHPDASPPEIAKMARDYLAEISGTVNPKAARRVNPKDKKTNWDEYFDDVPSDNDGAQDSRFD